MTKTPKIITDIKELRAICGNHHPLTPYKIQKELTDQAKSFIQQAPFVLLSTIENTGEPTISPKGGQPGFVGFDDQDTLYLPDKRGNNLLFSFQNILERPQVGLMFIIPGTSETLRVHGTAQITQDPELCSTYHLENKPARLITMIQFQMAYFHCSLSFENAKMWKPEHWPEPVRISWKKEINRNLLQQGLKDIFKR